MPELPSQPEGGRGDTAACTGGVICVEEQDGYEAATHAGEYSPAMGECLAIDSPAMMEGQATMYDEGSAESTEAEMLGDGGEQKEGSAVHTERTLESLVAATSLCEDSNLGPRRTQTLMTSFTSNQSLDEKRSWINQQFESQRRRKRQPWVRRTCHLQFHFPQVDR